MLDSKCIPENNTSIVTAERATDPVSTSIEEDPCSSNSRLNSPKATTSPPRNLINSLIVLVKPRENNV